MLLYSAFSTTEKSSMELQKKTKDAQKTEPRRFMCGTEEKSVPSAPPDNSANDSALPKRRSRSMSGHRPTSTSQNHRESGNSHYTAKLKLSKSTLNHHLKAGNDHHIPVITSSE